MKIKPISLLPFALLVAASVGCNQQRFNLGGSSFSAASSPFQLQLAWNANPGEQQGFVIEMSTDGTKFSTYKTVPDGTTALGLNGLNSGSTYYFRIHSYNTAGSSPVSPVITAKIP